MLNIELEITLKCNAGCLNCNKFCNMEDLGIIYGDEMDLSLDDIDKFIDQVKALGHVRDIRIMGGEPTVHPLYEEICKKIKEKLVDTNLIKRAYVVTNGVQKKTSCLSTIVQMPIGQKKQSHTCVLVSPIDLKMSFRNDVCPTPRVWGVSYNKLGWYPCGPGGAIARLFKMEHIRKDTIKSVDDWGATIKDVCSLCQNSAPERIFERDHGRPITASYERAIKNYVSVYALS
jgi:organic radical activating enzyme